ncbi:MAG TPA: hypothetical protein VFW96_17295 [Thermomicrobiales bacterium]|nr:hypothetical protein [Thermomicrobiales bacterium]
MPPHVHVVATVVPNHRRLVWLAVLLVFLVTAVLVAWLAGGAP